MSKLKSSCIWTIHRVSWSVTAALRQSGMFAAEVWHHRCSSQWKLCDCREWERRYHHSGTERTEPESWGMRADIIWSHPSLPSTRSAWQPPDHKVRRLSFKITQISGRWRTGKCYKCEGKEAVLSVLGEGGRDRVWYSWLWWYTVNPASGLGRGAAFVVYVPRLWDQCLVLFKNIHSCILKTKRCFKKCHSCNGNHRVVLIYDNF